MVGNLLKIKDLISELARGGVCIPEIQRSYVWKRSQIAKLLDSIYRNFPTGLILLWDTIQPIQMREMATNIGALWHSCQPWIPLAIGFQEPLWNCSCPSEERREHDIGARPSRQSGVCPARF